jgi:hypothetical protein
VEVLRERWRKDGAGAENGGQAPADREAICRAVAASRARKDLWAGDENTYEAKLEASLEEQRRTDAARPVVDVSCYYAVLYARTHRPIDRREFEPWLAAEAAAATRLTGELVALRNELRGRGELVDLDSLPLTLRSSRLDNRRTLDRSGLTLQLRYVHWLYWGIQCAAQAPCKAVVGWARANREALSRAAGEQLEEIAARLTTDPWLDLRAGESEDCLNLVHSYAQELERRDLSSSEGNEVLPSRHVDRGGASSGRLPLERDNVLLWLDAEIAEAQSRQRELDNVREVVRRSVASGSLDVALPFRVRLLFGADMGWDIPRWDQWEKACRGADARTYACGNGAALYSVLANWATKEPRSTERERLGEDVSPYGVAGLAGNVSEWVWGPEKLLGFDYARGGNWHHSREWGRADRLLRAKSYYRGSNAGVRVVRNLPLDSSLTRG